MDGRPELSPVRSTLELVGRREFKHPPLPYSPSSERMSPISVMSRSGSDLLEGEGAALRSASSALRFFVCLKGSQNCCAPVPVRKELGAHEKDCQHDAPLRSVDHVVGVGRWLVEDLARRGRETGTSNLARHRPGQHQEDVQLDGHDSERRPTSVRPDWMAPPTQGWKELLAVQRAAPIGYTRLAPMTPRTNDSRASS